MDWRTQLGVRGSYMAGSSPRSASRPARRVFADWTDADRERRGAAAPPRPQGVERNLVVTLWDCGRRPLVHARRDLDGQEPSDRERERPASTRCRPATASSVVARSEREQDLRDRRSRRATTARKVPSRFPPPNDAVDFWGNAHLWANPPYNPADPHNPMLDSKGRVWMTSKIREQRGSGVVQRRPKNKFAEWLPAAQSAGGRRRSTIRRRSEFTLIDTCYAHASPAVRQRRRRDACTSTSCAGRCSAGSIPRCTTSTQRRAGGAAAGAGRCSTPTATARSRSRGT